MSTDTAILGAIARQFADATPAACPECGSPLSGALGGTLECASGCTVAWADVAPHLDGRDLIARPDGTILVGPERDDEPARTPAGHPIVPDAVCEAGCCSPACHMALFRPCCGECGVIAGSPFA